MRGGGAFSIDSLQAFMLLLPAYSSDQLSNTALLNRPGSIGRKPPAIPAVSLELMIISVPRYFLRVMMDWPVDTSLCFAVHQ